MLKLSFGSSVHTHFFHVALQFVDILTAFFSSFFSVQYVQPAEVTSVYLCVSSNL